MIGSWAGMYVAGVPVTIIGETDWSNGGDKIIAKQGIEIGAIKGDTLGIYLDLLSVKFFLSRYLNQNHLSLTDFRLIEGDSPKQLADDFIAGKFQVIVNYDPHALRAVEEGQGRVVATSADYPGSIPEGFAARTDVLATMPLSDLVNILKGWIQAVEWTKDPDHWPEYQSILNERTFAGLGPFSEAELSAMLANVIVFTPAELFEKNKTEGELYGYLREANQFVQENGLSSITFTPEDIFDHTAMIKALTEE
jgi:NitT/TauT family transport system substrate-binding protein